MMELTQATGRATFTGTRYFPRDIGMCAAKLRSIYSIRIIKKISKQQRQPGYWLAVTTFSGVGGDSLQQAKVFLNAIKGMPMDLPPVVDIEEDVIVYGWKNYQSAIKLFLDTVEGETGRKPMIYTSAYYWSFTNYPAWSGNYPLWVANYGVTKPAVPKSWKTWTFWQYSEAGKITGIPYDGVDLDYFNGTYEDLLKFCNITAPPPVVELPEVVDRLPAFLQKLNELEEAWI